MPNKQRRFFIKLGIASVIGLVSFTVWHFRFQTTSISTSLKKALSYLPELPNATTIAQEYLAMTPYENDVDLLTKSVFGKLNLSVASPDDIRSTIAMRVLADYDNQDTVVILGWILSRTEARVCVLKDLQ